jgi:hypothetical protein
MALTVQSIESYVGDAMDFTIFGALVPTSSAAAL